MEGKSLDGHQVLHRTPLDSLTQKTGFSYTEEVAGSSPVPPTL